jgi:hypothetical protein
LIADPGLTGIPAAGFVLLTPWAGTALLLAVVTLPTTKPAFLNVASAASSVKPTTSGTVICADMLAGPLDTSKFTGAPELTRVPAAGFALLTLPTGVLALLAVVTVPMAKPASRNIFSAAACVEPITFGTGTIAESGIFLLLLSSLS